MISPKVTPPFPAGFPPFLAGFAPSLRQWHVSAAAGCCITLVLLIMYLFVPGRGSFSLLLAFRVGPPRDCDPLQISPIAAPCPAAPSPPPPCAHGDPLCCAPTDPSPPDPANLTLWREQLRGVVLALLYNRAPLVNTSVALLRRVYGRVFRDIVVYSDEAIPELGVLPLRGVESTNASSSSASTNRTRWYFAHATLADALARYPSAAGVLWCNDDVILNYWALAGANTSRIWFPNNPTLSYRWVSLSPSGPFTPDVPDWTNNPPIRQMVREAVDSLSPPLRARFEAATAEHEGMYTKRIADVVYVPMRHAPLIADHLLPVFSRVYSEVAVGNMLLCVEPFSQWDPVLDATVYLWDTLRDEVNASYSTRIPALHPWKLSIATRSSSCCAV